MLTKAGHLLLWCSFSAAFFGIQQAVWVFERKREIARMEKKRERDSERCEIVHISDDARTHKSRVGQDWKDTQGLQMDRFVQRGDRKIRQTGGELRSGFNV